MGLFKKTSITNRSNKIDAFQSTVCEFGTPVPLLYGTCKISPNLICYQDFETKEKRTTQKSGKSKSTTITYLYYVYAELALGEGIINGIKRIWVGDTAYSSLSVLNSNSGNEGAGLALNIGNDSKPTTYMSTHHADIAAGYTNLAYLYGKIFLGEDNASMPSYSVEIMGTLLEDGVDANPAYVIRDILKSIGLETYIDTESFRNYANYCSAADLLVSSYNDAFSSQKKAQEVIAELLELTNTYMFWSVDRFKFVPRDDMKRGTWQPNTEVIYDLDADELISQSGAPVVFKRKDSTEIYNYVTVNFLNRENDYEEESVSFQDVGSIKKYGVRSTSVDAKWFHTKERALKYAQMKTRQAQTECNQYTLKLPWKYCRLEPGDLIRVTDEAIGIAGQVVMVSEVTEDKNGLITVTALQRAPGDYSEAKYKVDNKYQYQDFNVEPGNTARPLFIIPPSDLVASSSGCELWIALHGESTNWGGCDVHVSSKDGDYSYNGTQGVSSVYGRLTSALPADGDTVNVQLTNPRTVELLTGSEQDAENGLTLIWINGECMSYSLATLTGVNSYKLSGLKRGQNGTRVQAHSIGDDMAVLDGNIYALSLPKSYIGKTLYFKFPAFNGFKANGQNLNDLDCYTCVAGVGDLPNCTDVVAYNKYRDADGIIVYHDIIVEWQPPSGFENYQQAQVWYKASTESKWQYGGQGYSKATLPQVDIGVTYTIAVCTQDIFGNTETPDTSAQTSILVALSTEVPNTPQNVSISIGEMFVIKWDEVHNADVKYYEVRLDNQVGVDNSNFIARVSDASCSTNNISVESGTIYIFAVSAYGKISAPATAAFSIKKPAAPEITVTAKLTGIDCRVASIPSGCIGVHWYFTASENASDDKTQGSSFFKNCDAGNYEVRACYYTYFGDGAFSKSQMVHVSGKVYEDMIADGAVTTDKLDQAVNNNLKQTADDALQALKNAQTNADNLQELAGSVYTKTATDNLVANSIANFKNGELVNYSTTEQTEGMINSMVATYTDGKLESYSTTKQTSDMIANSIANFKNGELVNYSTITQMNDAISLAVSKVDFDGNELISKINLADGKILLDGRFVHVTGQTLFDDNIVTNKMLQADCVNANNIDVDSLSAITATIGTLRTATTGARMELKDNLIQVYDTNNVLRVEMGIFEE